MAEIEDIKAFWSKQASETRKEMGGTLDDENLRRLEIDALAGYLTPGTEVLDVGCGNGYSTITFAQRFALNITGMDYSDDMIANANARLEKTRAALTGTVRFIEGDVLEELPVENDFDAIITERCLINLATWENQQSALGHLRNRLKPGGLLLMLEGFLDNLEKLNEVRATFELDPIEVVWHNRFFRRQEFEEFISNQFEIVNVDGFGSTYMLLTRTFLHAIAEQKGSFDKRLDELATRLPNLGDYNYQQLYVLRKK